MGACCSTLSSESAADATKWPTERKIRRKNSQNDKESQPETGGAGTERKEEAELKKVSRRMVSNGSSHVACLHTQQGKKGTNQDAMIVWEDFGSQTDTIFCGVFDGHGPNGHFVARKVRNSLPLKISTQWKKPIDQNGTQNTENNNLSGSMNSDETGSVVSLEDELSDGDEKMPEIYLPIKRAFEKASKLMDKELKLHPSIDCICSGCTAVTILKQGQDLIIGNIGDSRAVLATKDKNNRLIPMQLTVDLKPNLPREEERIRKCKGRVFALQDEPDVARVWLPNNDSPGLAMARAFGDFCLKDYGLISVPDISHYRLSRNDQFLILATDGVWDALSNKEAIEIVGSAPSRSTAARALVDCAVRSWRHKYPTSKIDDCAAICLFFDPQTSQIQEPIINPPSNELNVPSFNGNNNPPLQRLDTISSNQQKEIKEIAKEEADPQLNAKPLQRLDTISGCNEIELVIEEETNKIDNKGAERSQSTRSLAEFMSMADEEEWSALEGVTRVNSLLSIPRFLSRKK
ncbi:hypothetical protein LUZ60_000022 [Juncus effusus]|nr:hypothetical protein LUZ60_000022 [Juncus effusus]